MSGKVYLVGAGPGDPELLTLRAVSVIAQADAIVIDELVHRGCLRHAKPGFELIAAGKRGGCGSTPQAFIERLLIRLAKQGSVVVRLKGGDPFVFGRGGEELQALRQHGVDVEVVPGITAGIGVPAELGIPITQRGVTHGVTFLTGHTARHDWAALRATGTTLVIYMGIARLPLLVAGMLAGGFAPGTPACVIQNGTLAGRREMFTPLAGLADARLGSPAIIVVGEVVRLARNWTHESIGRRRVA
jgi:uroporphyrin-III C-methyltransferase